MNNNLTFYNPSVSLARATSLYTREAHHRPTVYLKGVTHYTLQDKACEKEYEQIVRTPFVFLCKQNLLYGKHPFGALFCLRLCLFQLSVKDGHAVGVGVYLGHPYGGIPIAWRYLLKG